jgi:PAS domain S-box-containing protein
MSIRFSDNILSNIEGSNFVIRHRVPRSIQIIFTFLSAFLIICLASYVTDEANTNYKFIIILVISIGMLGYATYFFFNRFRNLLLATEFQTAMLASVTQLGTRFCFIVNKDGLIFYVDSGFQKTFSTFISSGSRSLNTLFMFMELSDEFREKILDTLKRNKNERVVMSFKNGEGNIISVVTAIDVIPRPRGYFVIRGRDFVEKRSNEVNGNAAASNKETPEDLALLDKALYNMQGGILVADNKGRIVMMNRELEKFLGYAPTEAVQMNMRLEQICQQYSGHAEGTFLLSDFDGQITLKRRNGAPVSMQAWQRLVGDENHTLGVSLLINLSSTKL